MSCYDSICQDISKWVNQQLQTICKNIKAALLNSKAPKNAINIFYTISPDHRLLLMDTDAMHKNIDTPDTLDMLQFIFEKNRLCQSLQDHHHITPIIDTLAIIMKNNIFKFGDTFWQKINRTAMDTPPAVRWENLYCTTHKLDLFLDFSIKIFFYKGWIDNSFGIWKVHSNPTINRQQWQNSLPVQNMANLPIRLNQEQPW